MPSQKLIAGYFHWVRHPRMVQKISPEDDLRRRLSAAPTNLAKYYLVTAITNTYISSPGWGLFSTTQLREVRDTVQKTTTIGRSKILSLIALRLMLLTLRHYSAASFPAGKTKDMLITAVTPG